MPAIPASVVDYPRVSVWQTVRQYLESLGFVLLSRGKVRDTYSIPGRPDWLLLVTSDRVSINDFVLPAEVPKKGEVLTAFSHFWPTQIVNRWSNHLVQSTLDPRFNAAFDLYQKYGSQFPLDRSLVVKKCTPQPYELIFRMHPGGSIWKDYQDTHAIAGIYFPGIKNQWQKLNKPAFSPSTKSERDENKSTQSYYVWMRGHTRVALARETIEACREMYEIVYRYAEKRGVLLLDTKFEAAMPDFMLIDEVFTPDSSRFTTVEDYQIAMREGRTPISLDKQHVRNWGMTVETPFFDEPGINKLTPKKAEHVAFVSGLTVPQHVIDETSVIYLDLFKTLTDMDLATFQKTHMGVMKAA